MNKNDLIIRNEQPQEQHETENLVREAFWNVYRPGCLEHYVLHNLRQSPAFVRELNFVMTNNERLIGQNVFMRAQILSDTGALIPIMTMGPICILPKFQRQGLGKLLLDFCIEKARKAGAGALCFEGNIDFYGKSGFSYASDFGIRYHGLTKDDDASFFLCRQLIPGYLDGISGEYTPPKEYFVSEKDFEEFDKLFPEKEKKKLPAQIF